MKKIFGLSYQIEFTKHFPNNLVKYKKLNLGGKYGYKKTFKQEFEV